MWPSDSTKEVAYHEAGHAVAMYELRIPFNKVSISNEQRGVFTIKPPGCEDYDLSPPEDIREALHRNWDAHARACIQRAMVTLATGPIAQMKFEAYAAPRDLSEFYLFGGSNDASNIRRYAVALTVLASGTAQANAFATSRLIKDTVQGASRFVDDCYSSITTLASELIDKTILNSDEVKRVLKNLDEN